MFLSQEPCLILRRSAQALCTGEKGVSKESKKPLHYKSVPFHRIQSGFVAQACADLSVLPALALCSPSPSATPASPSRKVTLPSSTLPTRSALGSTARPPPSSLFFSLAPPIPVSLNPPSSSISLSRGGT